VARRLLGALLVRRLGRELLVGRIVETEAYVGEADRACHAFAGRTARNAVMYGEPGHAYVYFVYGMHDMLNVVCRPAGEPEAVLVRALEPLQGLDGMRRRRRARRDLDLTSGPGKLCRAFAVTRALNGADLLGPVLWIAPGRRRRGERLGRGRRIGVDYAGPDADRELRFWLEGNAWVSRPAAGAGRGPRRSRRRSRSAATSPVEASSSTPAPASMRRTPSRRAAGPAMPMLAT
jgi:DNA-3-methyladenine glycosylase